MAVTWNGNTVPSETDPWALVADMGKMAALNNRLIPVHSKAERDALAVTAPNGVVPDGTVVLRLDQSTLGPTFDVFTGGAWFDGDTGWANLTMQNGWAAWAGVAQVRRIGGRVKYRGGVVHETMTGDSVAFTAPPGFRPPSSSGTLEFPVTARSTAVSFSLRIGADGLCTIWSEAASVRARALNVVDYFLD